MNVNKHGIAVATPKKSQHVKPLEYALDEITYWRKEAGQVVEITVPKISHLRNELKKHGWRILK